MSHDSVDTMLLRHQGILDLHMLVFYIRTELESCIFVLFCFALLFDA